MGTKTKAADEATETETAEDPTTVAEEPSEPEPPPADGLPRRRIMTLVRVQGDTVGDVARALVEVINWLEGEERKRGGAGSALGRLQYANAEGALAYSVELDDDDKITPEGYRLALKRWKAQRGA